jgi:FHS family L-fucose permease-like MFS transporter
MAGTVPIVPLEQAGARPFVGDGKYTAPLAVLTTLFFMWGFLTCLNDILSPHLKAVFELNYAEIGLVQTAFFGAYFVMSLPSAFVVKRFGYKSGIIIGLFGAGLGCLLFYPAAAVRSFPLFLLALFVLASGITLLQVAANPFVAALGNPATASSRLTLTQAFNSLGTTLAPLFGAAFILSTAAKSSGEIKKMSASAAEAYRLAEASAVQTPYLGLAAALVVLALAIMMFKLPKIEDVTPTSVDVDIDAGAEARQSAWSYRHLVLGAVGIFVYVGAEVAIGNYLVSYFKEPYVGGLSDARGAKLVAFYWGGAMIGRFLGTITLRLYNPRRVLTLHALAACALVVVTMATTGGLAMWSIIAVGLFNSIMFPTIFTLAIEGLGRQTSQGSGILVMAIVGGAIIPPLVGKVADLIGLHYCFFIPALCYGYIAWYGLKVHSPPLYGATA